MEMGGTSHGVMDSVQESLYGVTADGQGAPRPKTWYDSLLWGTDFWTVESEGTVELEDGFWDRVCRHILHCLLCCRSVDTN